MMGVVVPASGKSEWSDEMVRKVKRTLGAMPKPTSHHTFSGYTYTNRSGDVRVTDSHGVEVLEIERADLDEVIEFLSLCLRWARESR